MQEESLDSPIVARHDMIAFQERSPMVLGGIASFLKVRQYGIGIHKGKALSVCLFHDADAPVHIG